MLFPRRHSFLLLSLTALLLGSTALAQTPPVAEDSVATPADKPVHKAPVKPGDYLVMKVNGQPIRKSEVEQSWAGLFPAGKAPDFDQLDQGMKQNILRGLAGEHLIYREAEAAGTAKSPEVAAKLAELREKLVAQTYLEDKAKNLVTDANVQSAYDKMAAEQKGKEEVKARHILVDTEDKAEEIEKDLKDGKDFGDIAKKMSMDNSNAAKGGDLGWFGDGQMVPEFSKAAFALKKGEVSKPVKTEFGWHVIQLEDRRPVAVPPFDQVKDGLRQQLETKALKTYVSGKVDAAKIEYFDKDGSKVDPSKAAPAKKAP